jgi:hypothetical protein
MSDNESSNATESDPVGPGDTAAEPQPSLGRRGLVGGLALAGVALGAGAAGGALGARSSGGRRREKLAIEIACLGPTMRNINPDNRADDADFRNVFLVEGLLYPAGTIVGDGFIPIEADAIGHWFCRGWFINSAARPQPHIASSQDFCFGRITPENLFPRDVITSHGLEGTDTKEVPWYRPVIGGTGKYFGATGEEKQTFFSENATKFSDGFPGLNFRIEFDLLLPD